VEILKRFMSKEHLQECHHKMSPEKMEWWTEPLWGCPKGQNLLKNNVTHLTIEPHHFHQHPGTLGVFCETFLCN
jgi:hypothetical protein